MKTENAECTREYDFALILTGISDLTDDVEDALFEAGCDDATLSLRSGVPCLTFSRTARSRGTAILSAIEDVESAGIGMSVLRVDDCDLVTQAEIARRIGRSRQLVHQYITGTRGPGGFPPRCGHITDDAPIWFWCEVARWLRRHDMIKEEQLQDAAQIAAINTVLELRHQRRLSPEFVAEVLEKIGA